MKILLLTISGLLFSLITTQDLQAQINLPGTRILDPQIRIPRATPKSTPRFPQLMLERAQDLDGFEVSDRRVKIATKEGTLKIIDRGTVAESKIGIIHEKNVIRTKKSRKTVNILPSDVKKKIPGARKIALVDEVNPKYQVTTEIKGKIFGFIPVRRFLNHQVNAQKGKILWQDKPWWWKSFVKEVGIRLEEGEACPLDGPDWCGTGLRCETANVTGPGTVVAEDGPNVGTCMLFPPAAHGRIFVLTPEGEKVSLHQHVMDLDIGDDEILDIKTYFSSHPECGSSKVTEVLLDDQGNFFMSDLAHGGYDIYSLITFASWPDRPAAYSWTFSVNDGPAVNLIDLEGASHNINNQIHILQSSASVPFPSKPC